MRDIKYIVLHCSATPLFMDVDAKDIDSWHKARGWKGIGYHYVIKLDGTLEEGRPIESIGAHVKGYNKNSIGICYIGGIGKDKKPADTMNELQDMTMVNLLKSLKEKFPSAHIKGHRDFPGVKKACPSFDANTKYGWV
jgi:N-acetylmuramoyl-L-alanine amidase